MSRISTEHARLGAVEALLGPTPYRVVGFLGKGGMSEVFVVEHAVLGRQFALKLLYAHLAAGPMSDALVDRMRVEAQATARLQHPHIVDVVDFWIADDGAPCIVMELLQGRTLADEIAARKALPAGEAIRVACEALSALGAAHALGIVHRDVKPDNIYLHEVVEYGRTVKLLDFGIARVLPDSSSRAPIPLAVPTRTGAMVGSPRFMSPEAARGERLDARTDLWSLGLVLYEMLTGHGPFDDGSWQARPPSHYNPGKVPAAVDAIVMRAISERREERYASAEALLADLRALPLSTGRSGAGPDATNDPPRARDAGAPTRSLEVTHGRHTRR